MASSTYTEYEDVEFLMFEHSKYVSSQCDIDLTCYETFYDSPCPEDENGRDKDLSSKGDPHSVKVFVESGTINGCCSEVPDVDCMWPNIDGGLHDVLFLYNSLRGELFSDFSPDDSTTSLSYGMDSLMGEQQVPTVGDNIGISSGVSSVLESTSTPEKAGSNAEEEGERSANVIPLAAANNTESDSQDDDARVPASCTASVSLHYIEE